MKEKRIRCVLALIVSAALFLAACASPGGDNSDTSDRSGHSDALTWGTWGGYVKFEKFVDMVRENYPDMELDFISYTGANSTGYSWAQMRADDIPDIFITSQILDEDLARERLVDLSAYPFINDLSTSVLDQVEIDGGIYLLPVNYAVNGIYYNKTLMEEKNWELPADFAELESLCEEIKAEGMIPGVIGTSLPGGPFSAVFNLAKTDWLTTPEGLEWEQGFLDGSATAEGRWEDTMAYVQRYIDIGMFETDPEDQPNHELIDDYLGNRKSVFCTVVHGATTPTAKLDGTGDELGMMPYIGEDGSKNMYMHNASSYFGISKRLTEPGNEKKLEDAINILSLLYSPEGQAAFLGGTLLTGMSVLDSVDVSEDSMIYDARQAMREGRVYPMTYVHWENVLADMGQAYTEWFRGENDMDGAKCIAQMDALQQAYLNSAGEVYFCESKGNFTLEETASLVGQALGRASDADAVMVPIGAFHEGGVELKAGVTGKLYQGTIDTEVANTLCPSDNGEYAVMTMTGAEAKELAEEGLDSEGDGNPFEYLLVTRGDEKLDDQTTYQVAFFMNGYTEEAAEAYEAEVVKEPLRDMVHTYLKDLKSVAPGENYWN